MDVRKVFDTGPQTVVHGVEVNREQDTFVAACEDGFRVYDMADCDLLSFREFSGGLQFATILEQSNILALLGAHRSPPPDCPLGEVVIWDYKKDELGVSVGDGGSLPLRVCISNQYYAPVCDNGVALFKLAESMDDFGPDSLVGSYPTSDNPHAIAVMGRHFFIFPGISTGMIQIVDLASRKSAIINAHTTAIRAIALSKDEELVATASDKGTLVRVWSTRDNSRLWEVRRGIDDADIFCLAFSPANNFLALTSDKGTLHIFDLNRTGGVEPSELKIGDHGSSRKQSDSPGTKSIPISSHRRRSSASRKSRSDAPNPDSINKLGTSPSSQKPAYLSSRSPEFIEDDMTQSTILSPMDQSTILSSSPSKPLVTKSPLSNPGYTQPTGEDPGITSWSHVMHQKAARFQDQDTQPPVRRSNRPESLLSSSPDVVSHSELGTSPPGQSKSNANKKYGNLANLPFAPRVLRDQYSAMSIAFDMQGASSPGGSVHGSGSVVVRGTLAQGDPPKGQIGWISENELCVVSAGRRGRWEKFAVSQGGQQKRMLMFVGWKPYIDED